MEWPLQRLLCALVSTMLFLTVLSCTLRYTAVPPAGTAEGYELYTVDHDTGSLRLDLKHGWHDLSPPQPLLPEDEQICDPTAGWLCSKVDCALE
jgi:hypothetical protein